MYFQLKPFQVEAPGIPGNRSVIPMRTAGDGETTTRAGAARRRPAGARAEDSSRAVLTALRRIIRATDLHSKQLSRERSEEHTSELQSLMRISYDVFCLKKNKK